MTHQFSEIMFTENVKTAQGQFGSREHYERFAETADTNDSLTERETTFIAARDSFYMATVNENGWPYVQHRGGPQGFIKVLSPNRLAYADFRGNAQMVTVGNAASNDRVSLILMDYPNRQRLKILGHMQVEDSRKLSAEDIAVVKPQKYRGLIERVVTIEVAAYDWNCPQHIARRYTEAEFVALHDGGKS